MNFRFSNLTLTVFIIFCLSQNISAQKIVIKGTAEGKPGELVRLIVYDDLFSNLTKTLDTTHVDSEGKFTFKTDFTETTVALLALGLKKGEFYLKPGSSYSIDIPLDTITKRGSVFDELPLQFNFEAKDDGFTESIENFNVEYNEFVIANTNRIYRNRDKKLIQDFSSALNEEYVDIENNYLKNYIKYTVAQLEWISKVKSEDSIAREYFVNQPILYHNIQYAEFFKDFFKARFGATKLYTYDELILAINSNRGYISVDRLLRRSDLLISDNELRELVAILLLAKKYYNPDAKKPRVIGMLRELHRNSKYAEIQRVAENYITKLSHLSSGSPAPEFSLKDSEGQVVSLSQFKGKFVLLNFNREDCNPCLMYLQNLNGLLKEFDGQLEVLSIVKEAGFQEISDYANERAYEWPILNLGSEILLLESYSIRAFPSYLLINPDLSIALALAPLPGEGLSLYIKRSMNNYAKRSADSSKE